jgi:hypothetical protein
MTSVPASTCWFDRTTECRETDGRLRPTSRFPPAHTAPRIPRREGFSSFPDVQRSPAEPPRQASGHGEIPLDGAGCDVAVRCAPYRRTAPQDNDLRGFVANAGASGDELRLGTLRPDVHEIRWRVGMCRHKRLDLIQGRHAYGSGRAVFVQDCRRSSKQRFHVLIGQNPLHLSSVGRTRRPRHLMCTPLSSVPGPTRAAEAVQLTVTD